MEFDQILHVHWYWQDLGWDYYTPIFAKLWQGYGPWLMTEFHFRTISWEQFDGISPNFAYALILKRSRWELLRVNFCKFIIELWPLIDVGISHFHLKSWEQIGGIWPNFANALILTRSRLGLLCVNFRKFITELWPLIDVGVLLNILQTNWWNLT